MERSKSIKRLVYHLLTVHKETSKYCLVVRHMLYAVVQDAKEARDDLFAGA
jgi:hypothetical protein